MTSYQTLADNLLQECAALTEKQLLWILTTKMLADLSITMGSETIVFDIIEKAKEVN